MAAPTIDFIYFDAGGGHRSAATALKAVIEQQRTPWRVRMVNLQEVLDSLDVFRKLTGIRLEDVYNKLLARGWPAQLDLGGDQAKPGGAVYDERIVRLSRIQLELSDKTASARVSLDTPSSVPAVSS